jgi:hydrogenase maturation protease
MGARGALYDATGDLIVRWELRRNATFGLQVGIDTLNAAVCSSFAVPLPLSHRGERNMKCAIGDCDHCFGLFLDEDDVILIDAAMSGAVPGTVGRFDAHEAPLPAAQFGMSTHGFGLVKAIELVRTLGQLPRRCVVYTIEGGSFALGDRLSPEVDAAVEGVVARILDRVCEKVG